LRFNSAQACNGAYDPTANLGREWNAMKLHSVSNEAKSVSPMCSTMPKRQFAWLEYECGMWYFITDLFAEPQESSRQWNDKQCALDELTKEGWTIVHPYPGKNSTLNNSTNIVCGYGLVLEPNQSGSGFKNQAVS
jgi:hypothetical protein